MSEPNTSGAVALVVHAAGDLRAADVPSCADVAEEVERHAADRRQEHVEVGPRDELREHACRSARTARAAAAPSATSKRRAMPGRCQTGSIAALVTRTSPLPCRIVPSGTQASGRDGVLQLRHVDPRLGDRDRRPQVDPGGKLARRRPSRPCGPTDRATRSCPDRPTAGAGPITSAGDVSVRSGRWSRSSRPEATARSNT